MPSSTRQQWSTRSGSSSSSGCSDSFSNHSVSTAPTIHSIRPSTQSYPTEGEPTTKSTWDKPDVGYQQYPDPRASIDTYASTTPSIEDLQDDPNPFETPDDDAEIACPTAFPSTPQEFADFFPSTRKLSIKHDDATLDGNMNLRIDTEARTSDGGKVDLTLFHLRMHDLKRREFSLRRYCRDSGREICHSSRKYAKPSLMRRPGLQRSMSSALSSLRSKSETKTSTTSSLRAHGSEEDSDSDEDWDSSLSLPSARQPSNMSMPTNTTQLEFSNYAHLDVKRRGTKVSKRYEFEYWGTKYAWKRAALRSGDFMEISYHLINLDASASIAHIVPVPLSTSEARKEDARGGWVPPCSMWISDEGILDGPTDVADAIVASGLIALVDDCIKSRWHQKSRLQMAIPMLAISPKRGNVEYIGPKRLIDEVFNRREEPTAQRLTPFRQTSA